MYFLADNSDKPKLVIALEAHWSACQLKSLNAVSTTFCTSVTFEPTSIQDLIKAPVATVPNAATNFFLMVLINPDAFFVAFFDITVICFEILSFVFSVSLTISLDTLDKLLPIFDICLVNSLFKLINCLLARVTVSDNVLDTCFVNSLFISTNCLFMLSVALLSSSNHSLVSKPNVR